MEGLSFMRPEFPNKYSETLFKNFLNFIMHVPYDKLETKKRKKKEVNEGLQFIR